MKPNDVPPELQAKVRDVLAASVGPYARYNKTYTKAVRAHAKDIHATENNFRHALGTNGDRPVTWDFIGRLAHFRPDLWAQIAPHIPGGHGSRKMSELTKEQRR